MPFKTFQVNEILTAADVNDYLAEQAVATFAGTAARGSAISSPVEGQVTYLEDSDSYEFWTGSAWKELTLPLSTSSPVEGDSLVYDGSNWVNGPRSGNAIINGDFGIWQRGTSFTMGATEYTADRWTVGRPGNVAGVTASRVTDAPANFQYAIKVQRDSGTSDTADAFLVQNTENAGLVFAGKTVTVSFWAKQGADNSEDIVVRIRTSSDDASTIGYSTGGLFGGGNPDLDSLSEVQTLTTSWVRYSFNFDIASTANALQVGIEKQSTGTAGADESVYVTGFQLEAGPVATPFKLAGGGSKAAELALCQRYYYRITADGIPEGVATGQAQSSTLANFLIPLPHNFRARPTALDQSGTASHYQTTAANGSRDDLTAVPSYSSRSSSRTAVISTTSADLSAGDASYLIINNTDGYLGWSAEL